MSAEADAPGPAEAAVSGGRKLPSAADCPGSGDPDLVTGGWTRRSQVDPSRVEEVTELYTSLGFEVRLEKSKAEHFAEACQACAAVACESYLVVYTRRAAP